MQPARSREEEANNHVEGEDVHVDMDVDSKPEKGDNAEVIEGSQRDEAGQENKGLVAPERDPSDMSWVFEKLRSIQSTILNGSQVAPS